MSSRLLALLAVSAAVAMAVGGPARADPRCDVAIAIAKSVMQGKAGRAWVGSITPDEPTYASDDAGLLQFERRWTKDPPAPALARGFLGARSENAIKACPSFAQFLARQEIGYGDEAVKAVVDESRLAPYRAEILTVSAPVVSADGREALVQTSVVGGLLAGVGSVQHLRLMQGTWAVTDSINLWTT